MSDYVISEEVISTTRFDGKAVLRTSASEAQLLKRIGKLISLLSKSGELEAAMELKQIEVDLAYRIAENSQRDRKIKDLLQELRSI